MPDIVAHGRKPAVYACGFCHLPDGQGRPENAALAGLPAAYIEAQVADFRSGARRSAWHGTYLPTDLMRASAESAAATEVASAAEYFSGLRLTRRVEVVEATVIPKVIESAWVYVMAGGEDTEALGQRIVEVAIDHERHELRDSASGYRAYVPREASRADERSRTAGKADRPSHVSLAMARTCAEQESFLRWQGVRRPTSSGSCSRSGRARVRLPQARR